MPWSVQKRLIKFQVQSKTALVWHAENMDVTQLNQEEPNAPHPSQLYQVPTEDGSPVWQRTFNTALKAPEKPYHPVVYVQPALAGYYLLPNQQMTPAAHGDCVMTVVPQQTSTPVSNLYNPLSVQAQPFTPHHQTVQQQQQPPTEMSATNTEPTSAIIISGGPESNMTSPPVCSSFNSGISPQAPPFTPHRRILQQQPQTDMSAASTESTASNVSVEKLASASEATNLYYSGLSPQAQPFTPYQFMHQPVMSAASTQPASSNVSGGSESEKPVAKDIAAEEASPRSSDENSPAALVKKFFILAQKYDTQLSEKDDIIRKLLVEKGELEQSLLEVQSSLCLMQLKEAEKIKERARMAEACLRKNEKTGWEIVTKVLRAMECICCFETRPKVKVYQCTAGHLICEMCRNGLQDPMCPACTSKYTVDIRNLLAEELALNLNLHG